MTAAVDVAILGGGVVGLASAYALAKEGTRVAVLDAGPIGRAASWAGAGLIPAPAEAPSASPMVTLRTRSARLFPGLAEALRAETGIDVGYRVTGGVDVAFTSEEEQVLRIAAGRWRVEGVAFERAGPGDFARFEPALSPELRVAYYLPDRAQVRNPRLLRALASALAARGVALRPGLAALGFERVGERIAAIRTAEGPLPCGAAVVAAGAWSGGLLEGLGLRVPTPPLKGQIVLLRGDRPLLRRIVEHGKNYLVPRDDGRILIGATEEDAGFDTRPTPAGVRDLLAEALRLCPSLAAAEVERSWAGLRPGSVDTRPYIGPAPGFENLIVAAGHKRAGLQLAPATAELVADLCLGRPPRMDLAPFRLGREPSRPEDESFRS